jgi:hypothetical protein
MLQKVLAHCAQLTALQVALYGLLLAVSIEAFTIWARYGLGLASTRDTPSVGRLTFGIRIHHGYVGVALATAAACLGQQPGLRNFLLMIALGLILSDLMHHFLVLWPLTGSPEFDLVYPRPPEAGE